MLFFTTISLHGNVILRKSFVTCIALQNAITVSQTFLIMFDDAKSKFLRIRGSKSKVFEKMFFCADSLRIELAHVRRRESVTRILDFGAFDKLISVSNFDHQSRSSINFHAFS